MDANKIKIPDEAPSRIGSSLFSHDGDSFAEALLTRPQHPQPTPKIVGDAVPQQSMSHMAQHDAELREISKGMQTLQTDLHDLRGLIVAQGQTTQQILTQQNSQTKSFSSKLSDQQTAIKSLSTKLLEQQEKLGKSMQDLKDDMPVSSPYGAMEAEQESQLERYLTLSQTPGVVNGVLVPGGELSAQIDEYGEFEDVDDCADTDNRRGTREDRSLILGVHFHKDHHHVPSNMFHVHHHHHHHHHAPTLHSRIVDFAEHPLFEACSAIVIITHSLWIGAYVEYMSTVDVTGHVVFTVGNIILTVIFFGEIVIKALAEGKAYITGHEKWWNAFDLSLLMLVVVEVIMRFAVTGEAKKKAKSVLKIAEMVRTARILRIFRFLKFSSTLSVIISQVFSSMKSLGWILIMTFMMMFALSVSLTTGSLYLLHGDGKEPPPEMTPELRKVDRYFGSVFASMYTIFASVAGGYVWADIVGIMEHMGLFYQSLFVVMMAFFTFSMLNIITGIFVDNATKADSELLEEHQNKILAAKAEHLKTLFSSIDTSGNGKVTLEEFETRAADPHLQICMAELKLPSDDAKALFKLLDENDNGELDADEFVNGLLDLKGTSTSLDMKTLMYESRHLRARLIDHIHWMEKHLSNLEKQAKKDNAMLSCQLSDPRLPFNARNRFQAVQRQVGAGLQVVKTLSDPKKRVDPLSALTGGAGGTAPSGLPLKLELPVASVSQPALTVPVPNNRIDASGNSEPEVIHAASSPQMLEISPRELKQGSGKKKMKTRVKQARTSSTPVTTSLDE